MWRRCCPSVCTVWASISSLCPRVATVRRWSMSRWMASMPTTRSCGTEVSKSVAWKTVPTACATSRSWTHVATALPSGSLWRPDHDAVLTRQYQLVAQQLRAAYDGSAEARSSSAKAPWQLREREAFLALLKREGRRSLLEIGAGAGHD